MSWQKLVEICNFPDSSILKMGRSTTLKKTDCFKQSIKLLLIDREQFIMFIGIFHMKKSLGKRISKILFSKICLSEMWTRFLEKWRIVNLITSNDHLNALRFYQKRENRIIFFIQNAINEARKIKPSIPLIGNDSIPINDELVLKKLL